MLSVRRVLEFAFLGMVLISAILLGSSQDNWQLAGISGGGAVVAWIVVDWLNWFRMPRWIANTLSIGVLIITMRDFFNADSSFQLISVANLLVYLQTILLFQEKTPRQYWQLAVLNLLQVVVATIFSLQFEGGFLFLTYMTLAGITLMLVTLEDESFLSKLLTIRGTGNAQQESSSKGNPVLTPDPNPNNFRRLPAMIAHMISWAVISVCFSGVLFVIVPRGESAWFGPKYRNATVTGISRKVDLDVRGQIKTDTTQIFRAGFVDPATNEPVDFASPCYYRGMALGTWGVENGNTVWTAPYDRLDRFVYAGLTSADRDPRFFEVEFTIEPTDDPLLFSVQPCFLPSGQPVEIDQCNELSAITRKRDVVRIEQSPFKYTLLVPRIGNFAVPKSWPYVPESIALSAQTMEGNPAEKQWLLEMDPARYPKLVAIAEFVSRNSDRNNHYELAKRLEAHFLESTEYRYTLDFTRVPRQSNVDAVEDFVANHKTGHCELYASALVLMLRSQGIPARLVVGYCGGSFNPWGKFYAVTNENAHAWVEAYIRPENCTDEMLQAGFAGKGGAWLQLDPTPPSNLRYRSGNDTAAAINLARSMWQEYVLGLDADEQDGWSGSGGVLSMLRLEFLSNTLQRGMNSLQQQPLMRTLVVTTIIAMIVCAIVWSLIRDRARRRARSGGSVSVLRRLFGAALSVFAPKLGKWLMRSGNGEISVPFYSRLVAYLERMGIVREPSETHQEFAHRIAQSWSPPDAEQQLTKALKNVVGAFHAIRFGGADLDSHQVQAIELDVHQVEKILALGANKSDEGNA